MDEEQVHFEKIGTRRKSRILALNVLYLIDVSKLTLDKAINSVFDQHQNYPTRVKSFASLLITGTIQNLTLIDKIIQSYLKNWTLERMAVIDRNILRFATFELLYCPETPVSVIINEAIEIAKEYSTADSGRFVNGLLDKIKEVRNTPKMISKLCTKETENNLKSIHSK